MALERLHKFIARAGIASRREAERLIEDGHVAVNGALVDRLGVKIDPERDAVAVNGAMVRIHLRNPLTLVLHKPPAVLSTTKDPEERKTVLDLVPGFGRRLFPVGRLDWDASGILILTDDGDLANRLLHPRFEISRTYEVKVKGIPSEPALEAMRASGGHERPAKVRLLRTGDANAWIELTIRTGRHHEVKEICAAAGHPVLKLVRTSYGPISLGMLPEGRWRKLTLEEARALEAMGTVGPEPVSNPEPSGRAGGGKRTRTASVVPIPPSGRGRWLAGRKASNPSTKAGTGRQGPPARGTGKNAPASAPNAAVSERGAWQEGRRASSASRPTTGAMRTFSMGPSRSGPGPRTLSRGSGTGETLSPRPARRPDRHRGPRGKRP